MLSARPSTDLIERGTPAFRQTTAALFAAGFATFALMYCMQPLLPELAREFEVSAATSSLAISLTTVTLAMTLLVAGHVLERAPRKGLIVSSLSVTALLTTAAAVAPSWMTLLAVRALAGVAFAGLPAIVMAYIGEEIAGRVAGLAMGIYVGGTAVGGMSGRLVASALTEALGWRPAVAVTGGLGLLAAALVAATLPAGRHAARAHASAPAFESRTQADRQDPVLWQLYALGFLFMGVFVAVYNYLTFRLVAPPYSLGHAAIGSLFLLYLVGMVSSPWAGSLAAELGRARTLGAALVCMLVGVTCTLASPLWAIVTGIALITFGFFAAHTITSSWVGHRAGARRAQAASRYIVCYYIGGSLTGTATGLFWSQFGWTGVVTAMTALLVLALVLLRRVSHTP